MTSVDSAWCFVLLAATSCAAQLASPSAKDAEWAQSRWPRVTLTDLEQGRALYVERCSGCHHLVRPERLSPDHWPKIIRMMIQEQEVRLTTAQEQRLTAYLSTISARQQPVSSHSP